MNANTIRLQFQRGQIDACAIAALFARGQLSPLAFTEACLTAAKETQGIFITLTPERARQEAAASTQRWREGAPLSPLDGIPVCWKDLFDIAGTRTTAGSATRLDAPLATHDAGMVARLTQAGMVTIGKTNLSEFAFSGLGINPTFTTPALLATDGEEHVPGGSSSGAARAVAQGVACIAIGTDTAGSVRIPAAFNGVIGFRASRHRYDASGVFPLAASLDTLGPLCRSVRDAYALDVILCGEETTSSTVSRLIVDPEILNAADISVRDNSASLLSRLAASGVVVEYRRLPALHEALTWIAHHGWPGAIEAFQLHASLLASPAATAMDPLIRRRLLASGTIDPAVLTTFLRLRPIWQQALAEELNGAILVTPTVAHTAPRLAPLQADAEAFAFANSATLRLTMPGSLLDMPGLAVPSGTTANGLYTSLLFSSPNGEDRSLLSAACAVAHLLAPSKGDGANSLSLNSKGK
ncbi:amidase family protein [Klebsiella variicola]|uniref:amidase family protein n=1 Tax=Klebsiella variicola TaxID=244366 RepID=UPI00235FD387|nr:amidase family protein [Klebsiella variicola]